MNNLSNISLEEVLYILQTMSVPNFEDRKSFQKKELTRGLFVALLIYLYPNDKNRIINLLNDEYIDSPNGDDLTKEFRSLRFNSEELNELKNKIIFEKPSEYNRKQEKKDGKHMVVRYDDTLSSICEIDTDNYFDALELVTESCLNFAPEVYSNRIVFDEICVSSSWFLLSCAYKGVFQGNSRHKDFLLHTIEKYIEFKNTHKRYVFSIIEKDYNDNWLFMPFDPNGYINGENSLCINAVSLLGDYFKLAWEKTAVTDIGKKLLTWMGTPIDIISYFLNECNCYDSDIWFNYLNADNNRNNNAKTVLCGIINERLLRNIPSSYKQATDEYKYHFLSFAKMFTRKDFKSLCFIESDEKYNENFRQLVLFAIKSLKDIPDSCVPATTGFINTMLGYFANYFESAVFVKKCKKIGIDYSKGRYKKIKFPQELNTINLKELCGNEWMGCFHPSINVSAARRVIYEKLLKKIPDSINEMSDYCWYCTLHLMLQSKKIEFSDLIYAEDNLDYNESFKKYFVFIIDNLEQLVETYCDYTQRIIMFCKKVINQFSEDTSYKDSLNINFDVYPYSMIFQNTGEICLTQDEKVKLKSDIELVFESVHIEKDFLYKVCNSFKNIKNLTEDSVWLNLYSDYLDFIFEYHSDDPKIYGFILNSCNVIDRLNKGVKDKCVNFALEFLKDSPKNQTKEEYIENAITLVGEHDDKELVRKAYRIAFICCSEVGTVNTLIKLYGVKQFASDIQKENLNFEHYGKSALKLTIPLKRFINDNTKKINSSNKYLWKALLILLEPNVYQFLTIEFQKKLAFFAKNKFGEDSEIAKSISYAEKIPLESLDSLDLRKLAYKYNSKPETLIYNSCKYHKDNPQAITELCIKGIGNLISHLRYINNENENASLKMKELLNARKWLFKTVVANPYLRTTMHQYCCLLMGFSSSFDSEMQAIIRNVVNKNEFPLWFGEKYDNSSNDLFVEGSVWLTKIENSEKAKNDNDEPRKINDEERLEKIKVWLNTAFEENSKCSNNFVFENTAFKDKRSEIVLKVDGDKLTIIDGAKEVNTFYDFYNEKGFDFKVNVRVYCPANASASSIKNILGAPLPEKIDEDTLLLKQILAQLTEQHNSIVSMIEAHDARMTEEHKHQEEVFFKEIPALIEESKSQNKEVLEKLKKFSDNLDMSSSEISKLNSKISRMFNDVTQSINEATKSDNSYDEIKAYLKGLFGQNWENLSVYTRTALISGHVLLRKANGMAIDYSGVIISICCALENELKECLYFGLQNHLSSNREWIENWPKQLKYYDFEKKSTFPNNGNWLTLGSFPFYLGLEKPKDSKADYYTEEQHCHLEQTLTNYIRVKYGIPDFELTEFKEISESLKKVVRDYRNPAAHTGEIDYETATYCIKEVVGNVEASEKIGMVHGILLKLLAILYPQN